MKVWYSLRVQCALSAKRQFGIWFVDGKHWAAWQLLAAAGYWSARARGKADPVILDGARNVAKQLGFDLTLALKS